MVLSLYKGEMFSSPCGGKEQSAKPGEGLKYTLGRPLRKNMDKDMWREVGLG